MTITSKEDFDRAGRAVKRFRQMLPALTDLARVLTGRTLLQVKLDPKSGGHTDGKDIYLAPPLSLGDEFVHSYSLCDLRDEHKMYLCAACRSLEETYQVIYHEVAHLAFDSFAEPASTDYTIACVLLGRGARISHLTFKSFVKMASNLDVPLATILRIMEDVRINRALFEVRPGMINSFEANTYNIMAHGSESLDGKISYWKDASIFMQILLFAYMEASGYSFAEYFSDEAVEFYKESTELQCEIDKVSTAKSVREIFFISIKILSILTELESIELSKEAGKELSEFSDLICKEGGEGSEGGDAMEMGHLAKDAKLLEIAVFQADNFDQPSARVHTIKEYRSDTKTGPCWTRWINYPRRTVSYPEVETSVQKSLLSARLAFANNSRTGLSSNKKSGRIDPRTLGKRAWNGDPRIFAKRTRMTKKDHYVLITMDGSGSMESCNRMRREIEAVYAMSELLSRLNVKFSIICHTGSSSFDSDRGYDLDIHLIKDQHDPWDNKAKDALVNLQPHMANLDGHVLEYARKKLDSTMATDKLIVYFTDGTMPEENHREEMVILTKELKVIKQRGYKLLAVGIETDSPKRYGLPTVRLDSHSDLDTVVRFIEENLT